jgi:dephospho-CoA kinase
LDRKKLRGIITRDREKKEQLELIVHPEVFLQMDRELNQSRKRRDQAIAIEVPLLFETGLEAFFDYVVTVTADSDIRAQRVMARDGVTLEDALALMRIQMPDAEKIKKSDFIINNSGSPSETELHVDRFYEKFLNLLKNMSKIPEAD